MRDLRPGWKLPVGSTGRSGCGGRAPSSGQPGPFWERRRASLICAGWHSESCPRPAATWRRVVPGFDPNIQALGVMPGLCTTDLAKDAPLTGVPPQKKTSRPKPEANRPFSQRAKRCFLYKTSLYDINSKDLSSVSREVGKSQMEISRMSPPTPHSSELLVEATHTSTMDMQRGVQWAHGIQAQVMSQLSEESPGQP